MLITPRPGTDRRNIRDALNNAYTTAENLRGNPDGSAYSRLLRYLTWATDTAGALRHQISDADIDQLVLTRRYHVLLGGCGSLAGTAQESLVNGLVDLELFERVRTIAEARQALEARIGRWNGLEHFVVADSSFYCHNPEKLADVDLHAVLGLESRESVRLLFPIAVVDELDALKESAKQPARWRASHTLGLLDELLSGGTFGVWREAAALEGGGVGGEVNVEIVLDRPGHVRLPIADDEIIDRAVGIQSLAARPVRLLTCDTGQHTRGCAAGLPVTKIPAKAPGPEPEPPASNEPGSGTRAQRRERQRTTGGEPALVKEQRS
ncbi:PIN domain-containing protein [Embleya sp. NPDC020630]|uniref:PIN domain-containing protein n=1 Tax=Embleya sp. NPDC020630 TaxID=3363979 RepID=UPI0037ABFAFE